MLLVGHSRPASGGEHHLSHYWEMQFLQQRRRALLHGAKVGVAAVQMAKLYEAAAALTKEAAAAAIAGRLQRGEAVTTERMQEQIRAGYARIADQVLAENGLAGETAALQAELAAVPQRIVERWDEIRAICAGVPSPEQLTGVLRLAGGPATIAELGVEPELLQTSLEVALYVRNRYTIIRLHQWL
jgi:glycerol-1-phosphate dehydrogenase [NAD(P)+]